MNQKSFHLIASQHSFAQVGFCARVEPPRDAPAGGEGVGDLDDDDDDDDEKVSDQPETLDTGDKLVEFSLPSWQVHGCHQN